MRRKPPFPRSFFNFTYSKLFIILLPLLIAVTLVSAAVFVYYPIGIAANWVNPPVRFQAAPGITTALSNDNTTAVVDVTTTKDLVLGTRHAFIWDDYLDNPFTSRMTANVLGVWSWTAGYIRIYADGPSGSWGEQYVAYYPNNTVPQGTGVVYVLMKEWHDTSDIGQYVGFTMIYSNSRYYTLEYHREGGPPNRFIEIWRYLNRWDRLSQTQESLADSTWFIFLGRRNVISGGMSLTVYNIGGTLLDTTSATDTSIIVNLVGVGIYDRNRGNPVEARFDDFVACADADPRFVNVTQLTQGWIVRLTQTLGGTPLASATASSNGVASLNVISNPIVRNGYLEIYDGATRLFYKQFSAIVGGDVYNYVSVLPNLRILDFKNFDSKPYDVSLRVENLNVDGTVDSMNIWISSGSSTSTPIRIYNNVIVTYETSTITLATNSLGYIYSNATLRLSSPMTIVLTFRYSLTGVEVEYLNSVTLRIHE